MPSGTFNRNTTPEAGHSFIALKEVVRFARVDQAKKILRTPPLAVAPARPEVMAWKAGLWFRRVRFVI
jgi:hypothetical protein